MSRVFGKQLRNVDFEQIEKDAEAEHTIELRMNDESESKKFTLMAIGYN